MVSAQAKASDLHYVTYKGKAEDGYLNGELGIGSGDYLEIDYCLNCGQIEGQWPLPEPKDFGNSGDNY